MADGSVREPGADVAVYRGRIAPTPTGYLHLGHYRTFRTAWERARTAGGALVFRMEDIDPTRCRPEFAQAAMDDLRWAGLDWDEGPYEQSQCLEDFRGAFERLKGMGVVYPCICSRRDVSMAASAPHVEDAEPIYPGICWQRSHTNDTMSWRFRVPDGEAVSFVDGRLGLQTFVCGRDFGDFVVWRRDDAPAYELAVVVDDAAMQITEVVRGEDLLLSTARQLLLYRALGLMPPVFYHCPLVMDEHGKRLAKRHDALSLQQLRASGVRPDELAEYSTVRPLHRS